MPAWGLAELVFDNPVSVRATIGKTDAGEVWQYVADHLHLGPRELAELRADFWRGDRLDKELTDFVVRQRPRCRTAILSNAWTDSRRCFEKYEELTTTFETWIISSEEGIAKPDPEIYMRTLRRLGVQAEEAAFVDDSAENVVAARRLGIAAIEFRNTAQTLRDLKEVLL